jgi:hypothetical protein
MLIEMQPELIIPDGIGSLTILILADEAFVVAFG